MRRMYLHELDGWPRFRWSSERVGALLAEVRHRQGRLVGRMEALGFGLRQEAVLQTLTADVTQSSAIEGERLDAQQVRSSIARRLGMDIGGLVAADRQVDGVVEMMLDATRHYGKALDEQRLFGWHAALFPTGRSGMAKIAVGAWRTDAKGPMQVVSGPIGRECVHFEAVPAPRVASEMSAFLAWWNAEAEIDAVLKAALAHLWLVTVHPFEDGNGRVCRAIADMALARADGSAMRFYSMSTQIESEKKQYYQALEKTQKGTLDITDWLRWFLGCLDRVLQGAETSLARIIRKSSTWERINRTLAINDRQRLVINALLDGSDPELSTSRYAKLAKCSLDTALRDIKLLLDAGILVAGPSGGRSTKYGLQSPPPVVAQL